MSKSTTKPVADETAKPTMGESVRETVDSIVIAFVLAFLFRTFEAEAFVIPTGSMALTLMGDHKDVVCSECEYPYRASASNESPNNPGEQVAFNANPGAWRDAHTVVSSVCPNCRYRMKYDPKVTQEPAPPSFKGDRILVTKYSYEFADPQRFDVAVFKNPSQAKINYIKRIVGLPREEVMVYRGDVYVRYPEEEAFRMARKPHDKAVAMAQTVYDNDYIVPQMHERGWPQRWVSETTAATEPVWKQSADLKSFRLEAAHADDAWIRYQHYLPSSTDWATLEKQALDPQQRAALKPQLVSDFCEYNTERIRRGSMETDISYLGLHWVGDIAVEADLEFVGDGGENGEAVLEIVEGGRQYQCRIHAKTGDAVLSILGLDGYAPTAKGAFSGKGPHKVRFANVDDQLLLWIGGSPVTFEGGTNFLSVGKLDARDENDKPIVVGFNGETKFPALNNLIPTTQDVASPIGIAGKNATLSVSHLKVFRDVHYVADSSTARNEWIPPETLTPVRDYRTDVFSRFATERAKRNLGPAFAGRGSWNEALLAAFMSDVDVYPERFTEASYVAFNMAEEQFFVLGDNSPRSLDGRLWDHRESFVKRELLIGKALFVYWPHALDKIPGTNIPFPFFPNVGRMRMIR